MNFDLSEEQRLLQDSVSRFVSDNYSLEKRNALIQAEPGFSTRYWQQFAELGWLALPFAEADGGIGGNAIDVMLLLEQLGKGLVVEPFLANVVLAGGVLRRAASTHQRSQWLPPLIDGSCHYTLAFAETQARYDLTDTLTSARSSDSSAVGSGSDFLIDGNKTLVLNGGSANQIVVSARTRGGRMDADGISLFLVDAKSTGVTVESYPMVDGLRAAEVTFKSVLVPATNLIGTLHAGLPVLEAVVRDAILAVAAEAVGAMEVLVADSVAYTQERQQFGHALAQFQVLQHRMVDMLVEQELTKSLLYRATMETAQDLTGNAPEVARTVHALKHMVGSAGTFVGENAVQLHGGMGMTEELRIGHYFKRLTVINLMFGDADYHLERFVA